MGAISRRDFEHADGVQQERGRRIAADLDILRAKAGDSRAMQPGACRRD
jgi:hypothetical protein